MASVNMASKESQKLAWDVVGGLNNEKRQGLLEAVDRLRDLGVRSTKSISLPQIVVVGDQSSGKSSLLEGITGFEFPVASELCTRFATHIIMKRSEPTTARITVSIVPGDASSADPETLAAFKDFKQTIKEADWSKDTFSSIMAKATGLMGLPVNDKEHFSRRFSSDVLKIEILGPQHSHFGVIDVPGLFNSSTKAQTEEDRQIVEEMVRSYINEPQTTILAVMDARYNFELQRIFELARATDPEGNRTVGVITKCDALQAGDESLALRVAKNQVERLKHGWFVVRNRSTKEVSAGVTIADRHVKEADFFSQSPWSSLGDRRGVPALKAFLGKLLQDHTSRQFPVIVQELETLRVETRRHLDAMGPARITASEQRQYLTRLAAEYDRLVDNSLHGSYDMSSESAKDLKLRLHLRNGGDKFHKDMHERGHARVFRTPEGQEDARYKYAGVDPENIEDWIRDKYRELRGAELLGLANPATVKPLFQQLSGPWEPLSQTYLQEAIEKIRGFNTAAYKRVIPEENVREALRLRNTAAEGDMMASAKQELSKVLADERDGVLQTVNSAHAEAVEQMQLARMVYRLKKIGIGGGEVTIDPDLLLKTVHISTEDRAVQVIHDVLKAYYQVALERFVDNVLVSVVERTLTGAGSVLKAFTPEIVGGLTDEELHTLAKEDDASAQTRDGFTRQLKMYQDALDVVRVV